MEERSAWLNAIDAKLKAATPAQAVALRDRIGDMFARVNNSFQAPTAPQLDEAAAIRSTFQSLSVKASALGLQ